MPGRFLVIGRCCNCGHFIAERMPVCPVCGVALHAGDFDTCIEDTDNEYTVPATRIEALVAAANATRGC